MTTRSRNLMALAAVLGLAAVGVYLFAPTAPERTALEAIPDGAFLVITVDLVRVRESALAREIGGLREVGEITQECGFDPLGHAKALAIGVPEKPDGVFGLSVTTDLPEGDLIQCAERVMGARSATPRVTKRGAWTEIEQEGTLTERTRAKIAHRGGAPMLIARGDYLATMQTALDGTTRRAKDGADHGALRKIALDRSRGDALLVATAVLPKAVRDKLKDEAREEDSASSERKKQTMDAVLSVNAIVLEITAHGDSVDVFAELDCETVAACATLREFIDRKRKEIADKPAARFVGLGGLLDALDVKSHGAAVELSLSAAESELARSLRALASSAFSPASPLPSQSAETPPKSTRPDETLRSPTTTNADAQPGFSPRR